MSEEPPKLRKDIEAGLRWLVCPVCRKQLRVDGDEIRCQGCGRRYPVVDGLPVLLANRVV